MCKTKKSVKIVYISVTYTDIHSLTQVIPAESTSDISSSDPAVPQSGGGLSDGAVVGIVVAITVLITLIALFLLVILKLKRKGSTHSSSPLEVQPVVAPYYEEIEIVETKVRSLCYISFLNNMHASFFLHTFVLTE